MTSADWKARAEREAAAILDGVGYGMPPLDYDQMVAVVAVAFLQGVNLGAHETLAEAEQAFDRLKATL